MAWLAAGVIYSLGYLLGGWLLRSNPPLLLWFRIIALLVPPMTGVIAIARRRQDWSGCQWLFWATLALGLTMSAVGLVGWTVDDLLLDRAASWLGWHTVFTLFGGVAPLFALLAQPHRGRREELTATTAVDIAGIAVMTGFLYSHFVVSPDLTPISAQRPSWALLMLCEFQQLVVCVGVAGLAVVARALPWGATYRRLALGLFVNFVILSVTNAEIWHGMYRAGFVYDVIWIMPFAFVPWAAAAAPASTDSPCEDENAAEVSRPWIVFSALSMIPALDFALRKALPLGPLDGFRDLFMAITIFSVLPLLMARLAVERGDARLADHKRRLLAAAIEQADDLISIVTTDGRIEHANGAWHRMLGQPVAEVVGRPYVEFVEGGAAQLDAITAAVNRGGVWRGAVSRRRTDGTTFSASATVVALCDPTGDITHFVAVERDVTRERQLQDQLIHHERLAAVGQLVSGVAHELNNPLQAVVGHTELLLEAEPRHETRLDLEHIRSQANRAAKIVRNLLSFVRRSGSERVAADLNDLVRCTIALRGYDLAMGNIEVEAAYADTLPAISVNREEIQQILLNLIMNAEQAMKAARGAGRLVIRTEAADGSVLVDVQDDGPGIPEPLHGRIFEPFFSTKGVGQGTGLGLSIALGIAEAHGGSLSLRRSEVGAWFRLVLPAADVPTPAATVSGETPASPGERRPRALVADDEAPLRELMERVLARRGFAVDVAEDGHRALTLVDRCDYDIVLCDVSMPQVSGIAVFEHVRLSRPHLTDVFVFITGDLFDARLRSVAAEGQIPILSKPFSTSAVDAVVQQVIAARAGFGRGTAAQSA
jgi:PAS domain S-box-containing protein